VEGKRKDESDYIKYRVTSSKDKYESSIQCKICSEAKHSENHQF